MLNRLKCQSGGSALISALFITTLVAIAATAMSVRLQLNMHRTRLALLSDKLYLASQGVIFWAMSELSNKKNRFTSSNRFGKVLNFKNQIQYPEIKLNGELYDLQARFNLNNLIDKRQFLTFLKRLDGLETKMAQEALLWDTQNWIAPYQPGSKQDEIVQTYLQQHPPYLPSFQPFSDLSEFRLIKPVSAKLYNALSNQLTALPEPTPINLNTASKQALALLGNGLTKEQVQQILEARGDQGIQKITQVGALLGKLNIRSQQITIESQYFLCVARVVHPELGLKNMTVLKRKKNQNGTISVSIISQTLSAL